jgi:hypothetical protein
MKYANFNTKIFLAIGVLLSFLSLTYSGVHYLEMRAIGSIIESQDYGDDVVLAKLEEINVCKASEVQMFLSEIRDRDERITILRKGMIKAVSRAKLFAGVEVVLWLISTTLFSVLLIRNKR